MQLLCFCVFVFLTRKQKVYKKNVQLLVFHSFTWIHCVIWLLAVFAYSFFFSRFVWSEWSLVTFKRQTCANSCYTLETESIAFLSMYILSHLLSACATNVARIELRDKKRKVSDRVVNVCVCVRVRGKPRTIVKCKMRRSASLVNLNMWEMQMCVCVSVSIYSHFLLIRYVCSILKFTVVHTLLCIEQPLLAYIVRLTIRTNLRPSICICTSLLAH